MQWGPEATGGSEGYHIELGKRLAKKGHEVYSFSNLQDGREGIFGDGVWWDKAKNADVTQPGVWIIQRSPELARKFDAPTVRRRRGQIVLFAAHDMDYPQAPSEKTVQWPYGHWSHLFDAILCESSCHAQWLALNWGSAYIGNIKVSGNGVIQDWMGEIDLSQRNPKVIFHPCNPYRGLLPLLKIFRRAYEEDSELRLRVAYGMDYLDALIEEADVNGAMKRQKDQMLRLMDHPGVENLGRLATIRDVHQEHAKAGMFVYSTMFPEICCVNLMEAQVFGSIPIVSPTMALAEYTLHGCKIYGDVGDRLIQARFTREILGMGSDAERQEFIRTDMMVDARKRFNFDDMVTRIEGISAEQLERAARAHPAVSENREVAHAV